MTRGSFLALSAALTLAACQSSLSSEAPRSSAPTPSAPTGGAGNGTVADQVTASLAIHDSSGKAGPFRLASLTGLTIDTTYRGAPGSHAIRIDVLGPGGTLYTQLRRNISADDTGAGVASQTMEVSGTPIELYHLVGSWQLVLWVDGDSPLAAASIDIVD